MTMHKIFPRISFRLLALATIVAFALAKLAVAADPSVPPHVQAAYDLLKTTKPDNTTYQHQGGEVHWQGDAGVAASECKTDCSGFVDALIKHSYGLSDAQLKDWLKTKRPLAKHYHEIIAEQKGFQKIDSLQKATVGDLLAVQYPAGEKNTGHMMLIVDAPRKHETSPPIQPGTIQWEVGVIDVSQSGHGNTDTRHHPDATSGSGLGKGVLRVYTDAAGSIAGYSWSTLKSSKFEEQAVHNMVIGRIQPTFVAGLKK